MTITRETKDRFVKMLANCEIVVIARRLSMKSDTRDYKFIGVHNGLKWDFTWCIVDATGCKTNGKDAFNITARSFSAGYLTELALKQFREEGIECSSELADNLAIFGM